MNELTPPLQTFFTNSYVLSLEEEFCHLKAMHPFHYEIFLLYGMAMFNNKLTTVFETFPLNELMLYAYDLDKDGNRSISFNGLRIYVTNLFSLPLAEAAKDAARNIGYNYDMLNLSEYKPGYERIFTPLFAKTVSFVKRIIIDELYRLIQYYQLNYPLMASRMLSNRVCVHTVGYPTAFESTPLKTHYIAIKTHVKLIDKPVPIKMLHGG